MSNINIRFKNLIFSPHYKYIKRLGKLLTKLWKGNYKFEGLFI